MKTDDPRLTKSLKEAIERGKQMNALTLAVIRGHLLLEQAMDEFIRASLFHPQHVQQSRFQFLHKAQICKSMSLNQDGDAIWELVWDGNELRNKIAHSLSSDEIKKKMDRVRRVYLEVITPDQRKGVENDSDDRIAEAAFYLCAGFLATLREDAKSRRRLIEEQSKPRQ
jgi:hypothetical protein